MVIYVFLGVFLLCKEMEVRRCLWSLIIFVQNVEKGLEAILTILIHPLRKGMNTQRIKWNVILKRLTNVQETSVLFFKRHIRQ